jgi:hypothetical protein
MVAEIPAAIVSMFRVELHTASAQVVTTFGEVLLSSREAFFGVRGLNSRCVVVFIIGFLWWWRLGGLLRHLFCHLFGFFGPS